MSQLAVSELKKLKEEITAFATQLPGFNNLSTR
jgi:hypothetical protein